MGTADYADWSRLGAGYRRQDAQWKLEGLEAWFLRLKSLAQRLVRRPAGAVLHLLHLLNLLIG